MKIPKTAFKIIDAICCWLKEKGSRNLINKRMLKAKNIFLLLLDTKNPINRSFIFA